MRLNLCVALVSQLKDEFDMYRETQLLRTLKGNEKGTFWTKYVLSKTNKEGAKSPIGDVRDRRGERNDRVYVLSRVRTNRVSLYLSFVMVVEERMTSIPFSQRKKSTALVEQITRETNFVELEAMVPITS